QPTGSFCTILPAPLAIVGANRRYGVRCRRPWLDGLADQCLRRRRRPPCVPARCVGATLPGKINDESLPPLRVCSVTRKISPVACLALQSGPGRASGGWSNELATICDCSGVVPDGRFCRFGYCCVCRLWSG